VPKATKEAVLPAARSRQRVRCAQKGWVQCARPDSSLHFLIPVRLWRRVKAIHKYGGETSKAFSVAEISQPKPSQPVKKYALNS
jgi:hypothetical protein